jgi:hypothetical protein
LQFAHRRKIDHGKERFAAGRAKILQARPFMAQATRGAFEMRQEHSAIERTFRVAANGRGHRAAISGRRSAASLPEEEHRARGNVCVIHHVK